MEMELLLLLHAHHLLLLGNVVSRNLLVERKVPVVLLSGCLEALHLRRTERVREISAGLRGEIHEIVVGVTEGFVLVFFFLILKGIFQRRGVRTLYRV